MTAVMIGVDPHKGSHTAVVISTAEEPLGEIRVRASAAQAGKLAEWAAAWPERTWAVEGAAGLGRLLAQQLVAAGERVLDVQPKLASRVRLLQAGDTNKNDPNDALSVAIAALRSRTCRQVTAEDHPAVLKVWSKRHRDLARLRNQVACRLHAVLCDLVPGGTSKQISAAQAARILGQVIPSGAVELARAELAAEFLEDMRRLDAQLRDTRKKLAAAVKVSGTSLTEVFGVGPVIAGTIIGDIADVSRFPGRDHFASYNGTAPGRGVLREPQGPQALAARQPPRQPRDPHGRHNPAQSQAQRRPRVLREEAGRGKNAQRGAQVPQAQDQRRHLRPPPGRRPPGRSGRDQGPGRAPGERLCIQRGRLTPRTPALRTSHSRTWHQPTTRHHYKHTFEASLEENSANHLTPTAKRTRYARVPGFLDARRSGVQIWTIRAARSRRRIPALPMRVK
jgi:transposase